MKRVQKLLLTAIVVIAGSLGMTACEGRDGVVQGTVSGVDPSSGQVQVVIYELERVEAVTGMNVFQKGGILQEVPVDDNGDFSLTLPPAEYILEVWMDGVEVANRMIEVNSGRTTRLDLETVPPSP